MTEWWRAMGEHRRLIGMLVVALLAHAVVVLTQWVDLHGPPVAATAPLLSVWLQPAPATVDSPELAITLPEPAVESRSRAPPPPTTIQPRIAEPAADPATPIVAQEPARVMAQELPPDRMPTVGRLLSTRKRMAERERYVLTSSAEEFNYVAFRYRDRPLLADVIAPAPTQFPFADAPRFVVDAYDDGVMGGVQRFWDAVTFEKVWVTENGTRIGCVWVLFVAGCGWE